ncbi:TenA family protein [Desertihabitans brevis]|uniref:TenA family protein n=1 Tax=Desertihabitans brevis TaxID=2268447 RepID=UPI0013148ECB|nr:TenA family protein [Desertihabitans brevis]
MTLPLTTTAPTGSLLHRARPALEAGWRRCVDHRFVRELFAGVLDDAVLAGYLVQDHQFFDGFLRLLGQALASADRLGSRLVLARQLGMLADDENTYFTDSFRALGVDPVEASAPRLRPSTQAFQQLMSEVVDTRRYPDLLAVLVVMEGVYLDWGSRDDLGEPTRAEHLGWVELHRGPDFTRWCQWLVDELERVCGPDDHERLTALMQRTLALEERFFDECW